jgi:hypothetical protein
VESITNRLYQAGERIPRPEDKVEELSCSNSNTEKKKDYLVPMAQPEIRKIIV